MSDETLPKPDLPPAAQRALADDITDLVHGEPERRAAEAAAVLGFDHYGDLPARLDDVLAGRPLASHTPTDRRTLLPISPVDRTAAVAAVDAVDADVLVEAILGEIDAAGEIIDAQRIPLQRAQDGRFAARFALTVPGEVGYTVRVTPQHPVLASRAELGLVATA